MTMNPQAQSSSLPETILAGGGEMGALIRSHDWSQTPLGSIKTWSQSLKTAIGIILGSRYPMFIWWGQQTINFYNDAYIPILGKRHPVALGKSARDIWAEIWHAVEPLANDVLKEGKPSWNEDFLEILERNGYPEETYFTFSYSPIGNDDGGVGGVFCACTEDTRRVVDHREMWEKIVLNLLSNAFKFTLAGEITVRLTHAGNRVELAIQDTGIGIAAAELPRLFERFYQVKGAKGRSFEGLGIGLSLVQELVLLHGGTIIVSSIKGEGSCFKVSIPTGFAHLPPKQIGSPQTITSTATSVTAYLEEALRWLPQEGEREKGKGKKDFSSPSPLPLHLSPSPTARILLVDDNADMRGYLKRLLSERWQVETAANGAIALAQIQQQPPDLVLTDIMMPQLDGLQLLAALRSDPQTKSIPIILLSARAGEEATIKGLTAGADDYPIKPFSAGELMARVETHLQLARLRFERSANRFKDEFLMTVTHELQAPLVAILGWARLLQTKPFDQTTMSRALSTIERHATIEASLVKDLLDVSSILSGKFRLQPQRVDLIPLTKEAVTTLRPTAEAKEIQLIETSPAEASELTVSGTPDCLRQIIANLLSNAIKFTSSGGKVDIQLERFGSVAQIAVTDTGIGIAADLPKVFARFSQAEVPSRHSPGGVGIGLAIARHLVQLHGGTIEVASEGEGRGTTFTVKLPLVW